jgi:hypothetical protein
VKDRKFTAKILVRLILGHESYKSKACRHGMQRAADSGYAPRVQAFSWLWFFRSGLKITGKQEGE